MSNLIGHSLGRYHILEQLGEGGMAVVYKAYDTRLETEVAVKVIRTENLAPNVLQKALIRFEREAKSLAKLTHPNIVKVLDYGEYEGKPYLVMPYLPGGTLKQLLAGKPIPWQQAASLLVPITRALSYAHQQGVVHRDVKPSNILITQSGEPMMTDFGIAKIIDEEITQDLTGTSTAVGTPEYMAPEQVTSKTVDHRADIYSLGIVFYEMVTGRKPFRADTPMAVLFKHASEPLPRPSRFVAGLPDAVERILITSLAKQPQDRYKSMGEFTNALTAVAQLRGGRAPQKQSNNNLIWIGGLGAAILAVAIFAGVILFLAIKNAQTPSAPVPTSAPQIVYVRITDTHAPTSVRPTETDVPLPTRTSIPTSTKQALLKTKINTLQARSGPDLRFPSNGDYPKGTPVNPIYQYHGWLYVSFPNGSTGWVALEWLDMPVNFSLNDIPQASTNQVPVIPTEEKKDTCGKYCN
jgi:serine/threonine protein kinase